MGELNRSCRESFRRLPESLVGSAKVANRLIETPLSQHLVIVLQPLRDSQHILELAGNCPDHPWSPPNSPNPLGNFPGNLFGTPFRELLPNWLQNSLKSALYGGLTAARVGKCMKGDAAGAYSRRGVGPEQLGRTHPASQKSGFASEHGAGGTDSGQTPRLARSNRNMSLALRIPPCGCPCYRAGPSTHPRLGVRWFADCSRGHWRLLEFCN